MALLVTVTEETFTLSKSLENLMFKGLLNLGKVKEPSSLKWIEVLTYNSKGITI